MAKTVYLDFYIHLNDPDRVAELQANPPGEFSIQDGKKYIIRAPLGAAEEFGNSDNNGTPLPFVNYFGPAPTDGSPYIQSDWFTAGNPDWSKNFPIDAATFVRKSGGWFGIPALFGQTTRFYWRGVFVYDAPLTSDGTPAGPPLTTIYKRRFIDPYFVLGGAPSNPSNPEQEYAASRDASPFVDGIGLALRGGSGVRSHTLTEYTGGGASTLKASWERLYVRRRNSTADAELTFWRCKNTAAPLAGAALTMNASGQIVVYNINSGGTFIQLGSTTPLVLNKWTKLDIIVTMGSLVAGHVVGGQIWVYINGSLAITIAVPQDVGLNTNGFHNSSEVCTPSYTGKNELDIGYWMNADIAFDVGGQPILTTDFLMGSRPVWLRPTGDDASRADWTGDWRGASQLMPRSGTVANGSQLVSTVANARLAFTTNLDRQLKSYAGNKGVAGAIILHHGWKAGAVNPGKIGYKLNGGADVLKTMAAPDSINNEGGNSNSRNWGSMMYQPTSIVDVTSFVLLRLNGNDAVQAGTDHLTAIAELIGTFQECDYIAGLDPTLRDPRPFLGIHNSPYPRSPWATASNPPLSPVIIKAGTYNGNGTFQDLTFKAPVNWVWILKYTNVGFSPQGVRWFSSCLGSHLGGQKCPAPWMLTFSEIDPSFTTADVDNPPTGVGAPPDRSAQVASIVAANSSLLPDSKGDLLRLIIRELNSTNPGDGNNWGLLEKTDQGNKIPDDIIMWNANRQHFDVLTDTGATWIDDGIPSNLAWIWLQVKDEGQQELQTVMRIAGDHEEINKVGESYAYVAVMDPGMRFMLNGAISHYDAVLPKTDPLISTIFTPGWAFYWDERSAPTSPDTNQEMGVKGPGHAASSTTKLNTAGTTNASALTFGAGALTLDTGLGFGTDTHLPFSLWRNDDHSGDPGVSRVVAYGSYTGDGNATRTLNINLGGRRPLWALFVGEGQEGIVRHPFHSGNNSARMTGLHITTGLRGGDIDTVLIGVSLNTGGVKYHYFILPGDTAAGNDGWSGPGEFVPVEPNVPEGGGPFGGTPEDPQFPAAGGEPGTDTPGAPGGGADDILTDLSTACVPFTLRVFNQALTRIGISKRIANAATDNTEPADVMRGAYAQAIKETLRDFPWPFATRYAALSLLTGSTTAPANRDWTYAYQQPGDCIFERRIVVVREGAVDPEPPPFQLSFDNTLQVPRIFTNQASATLEYTARPECSAGVGDPLFIEALIWKLASKAAGPLTRIADVTKLCEEKYDAAIDKARQIIRPGNPGPRLTTVDPTGLDPDPGALEANVSVANRALLRIGANTIANMLTEQSREAEAVRLLFEEELVSTLRDYPWAFATEYTTPVLIAGTATTPVNDDWQYSYRMPSNAVAMRRITTDGVGRRWNPDPAMWRLARDLTGPILFTDEVDPVIEYTQRLPNCILRSDPLFRDAFAWRLAASLVLAVAQRDPDQVEQQGRGPLDRPRERKATEAQLRQRLIDFCWNKYREALAKATQADATEQQQDPNTGDAPWISGRN